MTLRDHLNDFYTKFNIPEEGGINDKTFLVPLPFISFTLPNFEWRKRMLYVHDLEHILNGQDTSWKGEIFIASWEISTGFFRSFPLIVFPLWTMGWGIWKDPMAVWRGFKKGYTDLGIAHLPITKDLLLDYTLAQLQQLTLNKRLRKAGILFSIKFIVWLAASQLVFLFPFLSLTVLIISII